MKPPKNFVKFFILPINADIDSIILGKRSINQPINIIPKKSNIRPRNPLVLFATKLPCLFIGP